MGAFYCTNVFSFVLSFAFNSVLIRVQTDEWNTDNYERNSISRSESGPIVTTSLVIASQWHTKGMLPLTVKCAPVLWHCYQTVASDTRVVLLIETSSEVHRGHSNWLTEQVHSAWIQNESLESAGERLIVSGKALGTAQTTLRSDVWHLMEKSVAFGVKVKAVGARRCGYKRVLNRAVC